MTLSSTSDLIAAVVALVIVAGAVLLVRSRMTNLLTRDAESIAAVSAAIIAVYGLILGLTLAAAWERYQDADDILTAELNELYILSRLAYNWPGEAGEQFQQSLVAYGLAVSDNELTGQSADEIDGDAAREIIQDIYRQLADIMAGPLGETEVVQPAWNSLAALDAARGNRLQLTRVGLPDAFWSVLYLGGLLSLVALVLIHPASQPLHVAIAVSAAALIVVSLILLRDLDGPFQGASTVDFDAFRKGIDVLARSIAQP